MHRVFWIALWTGVALFLLVFPASMVQASVHPTCRDEQVEWVSRCSARLEGNLHADACPPGALIVRVDTEPPLRIELNRQAERGFVSVADIGISPIGNFPSWKQQPPQLQAALDHVVACVAADPSLEVPAGTLQPHTQAGDATGTARKEVSERTSTPGPIPWLLVLAGMCALAARLTAPSEDRLRLAEVRLALGICLATAVFWLLSQPSGFFHQNGHGGLWVEYALFGHPGIEGYGPGYREVFGLPAISAPDIAETRVFFTQTVLAALCPLWAWIIARAAGLGHIGSGLLSLLFAVDPWMARAAQSESYFAIMLSLLMAAAALLIRSTRHDSPRDRCVWFGLVGTGLLVAQAARIHPLGWIPAATLPVAVLAVGHGWRRAVLATGVIAITVGLTAGPSMATILQGPVGTTWTPSVQFAYVPGGGLWLLAGVLLCCVAAWAIHRRQNILSEKIHVTAMIQELVTCVLAIWLTGYIAELTNFIRGDALWFRVAYPHLFAPALFSGVAGLLACYGRRLATWLAALLLVWTWCVGMLSRPALTEFSTDVAEANLVREWRDSGQLPRDTPLYYLGRAGARGLVLPLYGRQLTQRVSAEQLAHTRMSPRSLYYRSSLCATPEGTSACEAFERAHNLTPIHIDHLDPVASQPWLPLPDRPIDVMLATVEPRDLRGSD